MPKYESTKAMLTFYKHALINYDKELRPYIKERFEQDFQQAKSLQDSLTDKVPSSHSILWRWQQELNQSLDKSAKNVHLLDKPFRLFVIGSGNVGKSTVINTLVGEEVAAMDVLPKTWRLDIYMDSTLQKVEFHYANQNVVSLPKSIAAEKINEEDEAAESLDAKIQRDLRKLRRNKELSEIRKKAAKKKILQQYDNYNGLTEVIWPIQNNEFLKKFTLVDTPGTNQTLYNTHIQKDAYHYYEEANGILWILPADKISDQNTKAEIEKVADEFHGKMNQTIAIINKWDAVKTQEAGKSVISDAQRNFGKYFNYMYPYHGEANWQAIQNEGKCTEETEHLREEIHKRFYRTSQETQIHDVAISLYKMKSSNIDKLNDCIAKMSSKKTALIQWQNEWNHISSENQKHYLNQVENLVEHQFGRISDLAERNENTLQSLENAEKNSFLFHYIVDFNTIKTQYERLEAEIIQHMQLIMEQFLSRYTRQIKSEDAFFNIDIDMIPKVKDIISYDRLYVLTDEMNLSTNKVGNFFRRTFNISLLSEKIKTEYRNRFNQIAPGILHDIETTFSAYNIQMDNLMEKIFADNYFPVQNYNEVMMNFHSYRYFLENWQLRKPTLLSLLLRRECVTWN